VRGGRYEALEGKPRARNVVIEFDSYEAARAEYRSAEYKAARALREGAAEVEIAGGRCLTPAAARPVAPAGVQVPLRDKAGRRAGRRPRRSPPRGISCHRKNPGEFSGVRMRASRPGRCP
jgi:hypothetical protein